MENGLRSRDHCRRWRRLCVTAFHVLPRDEGCITTAAAATRSCPVAAGGVTVAAAAAHQTGPGGQGYGPRAENGGCSFMRREMSSALEFFRTNGYAVIEDALSADELAFLNGFCDRTQRQQPKCWGIPQDGSQWKGGIYLQPLLDHPSLDRYMRHPSTFPLVDRIMGGQARFAQFDFRETPAHAGAQRMQFHHDHALPSRLTRPVYDPPDFICTIHYLSDVLGPGASSWCSGHVMHDRFHAGLSS
jgi:hypothetical protein